MRSFDGREVDGAGASRVRAPTRQLVFTLSIPLLVGAGGCSVAMAQSPSAVPIALPGIAEAIAQFDQLDAPGVSKLQKRLIVFEGALAVGLPCIRELRADASRGVTIGCLQFGLLGRLQPVLLAMDRAHPDRFSRAFGTDVEIVRAMLRLPTIAAQAAWGRSIAGPDGPLTGSWGREFEALAAMPEFQRAYLESTTSRYRRAIAWTEQYGLRSRRALAMMFDLALFRGIPSGSEAALVNAVKAARSRRAGDSLELARLRALAEARIAMQVDPDPLLRFHLTTIAEGHAVFRGYALDLADFGITLDSIDSNDLP